MLLCLSLDPKWSDLGWAFTCYVLFLLLFFGLVGFSSKCPGLRSAWSELMLVVNTAFGKSILPQLCPLTALYLMSSHMQAGRPLGRLLQRSGGQRGETMKQRTSIKRDRRVRNVWFQSQRTRPLRVKELWTPKGWASNSLPPPSLPPSRPSPQVWMEHLCTEENHWQSQRSSTHVDYMFLLWPLPHSDSGIFLSLGSEVNVTVA